MARALGGLDPDRIQHAIDTLIGARDLPTLRRLVDEVPVLRHPAVHAVVRQEYLRSGPVGAERSGFKALYEAFCFCLQERAWGEIWSSSTEPPNVVAVAVSQQLPDFFRALLESVGSRLPAEGRPPYAIGSAEFEAELRELAGGKHALPTHLRVESCMWVALTVECAACKHHRLIVHPYAMDFVAQPDLRKPALDGRFLPPPCRNCGQRIGRPVRVWFHDGPATHDGLEAMSCAIRVETDLLVYVPPTGMARNPDHDRIHEMRFDLLLGRLGWLQGESATRMAVVYSWDKLRESIHHEAAADFLDRLVAEVRRKMRERMVTLAQALDHIRFAARQLGSTWPIVLPGEQPEVDPTDAVLFTAAAVELAEIRQLEPQKQAALGLGLGAAFLKINEPELARSAIHRVRQLIETLPDDELRRMAEMSATEIQYDIESALGNPPPQHLEILEYAAAKIDERQDIASELLRAELASARALTESEFSGSDGDGQGLAACVESSERLLKRVESEPSLAPHLPRARTILSGALANYAAFLQDRVLERCDAAESGAVREQMEELLRRALELSVAAGAWQFAAIQAHRLIICSRSDGRPDEARAMAERASEYARACGDHVRAWTSQGFIAAHDLSRGQGASAQHHTQLAAVEWMQLAVGLGHRARPAMSEIASIALHGFECIRAGGTVEGAVGIVEGIKVATTAAALSGGMPRQLTSTATAERLRTLGRERERLKLTRIWGATEDVETALHDVEQQLERETDALTLAHPAFTRWIDATDLSLPDLESVRAVIATAGDDATFIGLLPAGAASWIYLVSSAEVSAFRADLPGGMQGSHFDAEGLVSFSRAMLTPVSHRLRTMAQGARIWISPTEGFYDFPFHALLWRGRRFAEHFAVTVVQSADILCTLLRRPPAPRSILALAPQRPDMDELHGAENEVREIKSMFDAEGAGASLLTGSAATIPRLVEAREYGILHFACHARQLGHDEQETELLLSPDPLVGDSGELAAGRILSELELPSGCTVNLAACASGRVGPMEGMLSRGLVPALLFAGASTVIATLWSIDDRLTRDFTVTFYRHWLRGSSAATALAQTQQDCLLGRLGPELREPRNWAAFIAYGAG